MPTSLIQNVCEMSASFLYACLGELMKLPASERHQALVRHFEACIAAYREFQQHRLEPSEN